MVICSCGDKGTSGPPGTPGESLAGLDFQQGISPSSAYDGAADSYLEEGAASGTNFGSADGMYAGYDGASGGAERSVLRFDVSALSSQPVTVKYAYLILYVNQRVAVADFSVTPHMLAEEWNEGQATWTERVSGTGWTTAGGYYCPDPAGGSVVMDVSGVYKTFTLEPSVVQGWIDSPAANHGLILVSDIEGGGSTNWVSFVTGDYGVAPGLRPRLAVYYSLE